MPPPESYGCLLTFVKSHNLILKKASREGRRDEHTWDFARIGSELGKGGKEMGRPISDSSTLLPWEASEESDLELSAYQRGQWSGSSFVRPSGDTSFMKGFKNQKGSWWSGSWKEPGTSKGKEAIFCSSIFAHISLEAYPGIVLKPSTSVCCIMHGFPI